MIETQSGNIDNKDENVSEQVNNPEAAITEDQTNQENESIKKALES